jgi:RNA polymerase sigma factor (sigma-70 family)
MTALSPRSDSEDTSVAAELYQRYAPMLFAWLRQRTSWEDAEDLLLEVFLAAFERDQLLGVPESKRFAWLVSVAQHKLIDQYRRSRRRPVAPLDEFVEALEEDEALAPEQVALRHERYAHLYTALRNLPALQQRILFLRFADGLHSKELAAALGKREGAVRVLLWRALRLLRAGLENDERGSEADGTR